MIKKKVAGIILLGDEFVHRVMHHSLFVYLPALLVGIFCLGFAGYLYYYALYTEYYAFYFFLGVGILNLLLVLINFFSDTFIITNERIIYKKGVLNLEIVEVDMDNITNIKITQRLVKRLLNYGNVLIDTAGSKGFEIEMMNIDNPKIVQHLIKKLVEEKDSGISKINIKQQIAKKKKEIERLEKKL